jgi:type 1 glutamine amidotransferase
MQRNAACPSPPSSLFPLSVSLGASLVALLGAALGFAPAASAQSDTTTVVFLAGSKDHGFDGRHEYEKDLRVLAQALETSSNLDDVETRVYVGKAPRDLGEIADADVFVIESSSDRAEGETHPLFPPDPLTPHRGYDDETSAYLESFDALVGAGAGVVLLHYATWAENWDARGYYLDWTGGLWVQMASRNPVDEWSMQPVNTTHPVLRGVHAWRYRDEVFSRFFLPDDFRRTNLLIGTPEQDRLSIGPQVVAWAYQRDDGGRGFVFGGVDYHDNMLVDDYRKFILNGIVWAAGRDVPAGGVQSATPEGIEPYVVPVRR